MNIRIEKLVTGGQGMGILPDGRKVFVWNALPGELVDVELLREKHSYAEGIATTIIEASADRITPREPSYLATSPWQILTEDAELRCKLAILHEQFEREHLDASILPESLVTDGKIYNYRNKVEFGFVQEAETLKLAVTGRRSHERIVVNGSELARPELNRAADEVLGALNQLHVTAENLSHITLRCSEDGSVAASLTVRTPQFAELPLVPSLQGLQVMFVGGFGRRHQTKVLQLAGDISLVDTLLKTSLQYSVMSFFQINLPLYEQTLKDISAAVTSRDVVELYAGVGSIGLTIGAKSVALIDIDRFNTVYAKQNLRKSSAKGEVVHSSSEKALEYIAADKTLILDPPRAGLSPQVVSRLLLVRPPQIIYLSCDPATLARDLAKLGKSYTIKNVIAYNFFPRTPHIETLVVLSRS